ncbi:MAG: response regulator [bacterium]
MNKSLKKTLQETLLRVIRHRRERARRNRSILVMDDEEMLRDLSAKILTRFGYRVTTAADGREAIQLYKKAKRKKPFDAVIMDLTIPNGMGGKETIGKLREFDPNVKAIISSGCSRDHPVIANYRTYGFSAAISKPFEFRDLNAVIRKLIN